MCESIRASVTQRKEGKRKKRKRWTSLHNLTREKKKREKFIARVSVTNGELACDIVCMWIHDVDVDVDVDVYVCVYVPLPISVLNQSE